MPFLANLPPFGLGGLSVSTWFVSLFSIMQVFIEPLLCAVAWTVNCLWEWMLSQLSIQV